MGRRRFSARFARSWPFVSKRGESLIVTAPIWRWLTVSKSGSHCPRSRGTRKGWSASPSRRAAASVARSHWATIGTADPVEGGDRPEPGHRLFEELQPLAGEVRPGDARDVPAWAGQAGDEARSHRIARGAGHHDRDSGARPPGRPDARLDRRDDDVDAEPDQFGGQARERVRVELAQGAPELDHHVLAHDVAVVPEADHNAPVVGVGLGAEGRRGAIQDPEPRGLPRLLGLGRERCGEESEGASEECSPADYWITSSARASTAGGIVRLSAFAVLRLSTSRYLVGCSTGRSAGFAPWRILAARLPARRMTSSRSAE